MVRVFLREIRKKIVGIETDYAASDMHTKVGQYFCNTIQSHRVMTEFREADFHRHTSMAPSVVNQLFYHIYAKVDVDVLKVKIWE